VIVITIQRFGRSSFFEFYAYSRRLGNDIIISWQKSVDDGWLPVVPATPNHAVHVEKSLCGKIV
jgi:hypothetical protein